MALRRFVIYLSIAVVFLLAGLCVRQWATLIPAVHAQQNSPQAPQQPVATPAPTLKSESRIVRVDVIVTDKKGNYIHDLTAKDFRVLEDNKPQEVTNFSFGSDPNSLSASNKHYMVLLFDDSTMEFGDQAQARAVASKFIEANAGPDRLIAVFDFGGALWLKQNFTSDVERLKAGVAYIRTSSVSPNTTSPTASLSGIGPLTLENWEADFGAYTLLLAIRSLAKDLASIPGRKSLILFTSGFQLEMERQYELTTAIDSCNKANVAVYPVDVRGLVTGGASLGPKGALIQKNDGTTAKSLLASKTRTAATSIVQPRLQLASYSSVTPDPVAEAQHGGGGGGGKGGGGGGGGSGGGGGGKGGGGGSGGGGGGGSPTAGAPNGSYRGGPIITPPIPSMAGVTQLVLYQLAEGTGGFPIINTNGFLPGLTKISHEQDEYYLLGYVPEPSAQGSCHTLKVKVERVGINVRARSGYCNVKPRDLLAGKTIEKDLEARASSSSPGNMRGTLETSFLYSSPNEARVNLAMEFPSESIEFDKVKGKHHAEVNVLGIAYNTEGLVSARFSDKVVLDLDGDEWKEFTKSPMNYQNQFSIAPGKYRLILVLSSGGKNFGRYEAPVLIDPYDGTKLSISGLALSNKVQRSDTSTDVEADFLADRIPLLVHDYMIVPSATNHFKRKDQVLLYVQVYEPRLNEEKPPAVHVAYQVVDSKSGKPLSWSGLLDVTPFILKGNPIVPLAIKVPVDKIPPGAYQLEFQAIEAGGSVSQMRTVSFETE